MLNITSGSVPCTQVSEVVDRYLIASSLRSQIDSLSGNFPSKRQSLGGTVSPSIEQSRRIMRAAEQKAEHILINARAKANKISESAWEEGFEAGQLVAMKEFVARCASKEETMRAAESDAITLALAISEQVIGESLEDKRSAIAERIKKGISQLANARTLAISVNPADFDAARVILSEPGTLQIGSMKVELTERDSIEPGGFQLESDVGSIRSSIWSHLEKIRDLLRSRSL